MLYKNIFLNSDFSNFKFFGPNSQLLKFLMLKSIGWMLPQAGCVHISLIHLSDFMMHTHWNDVLTNLLDSLVLQNIV